MDKHLLLKLRLTCTRLEMLPAETRSVRRDFADRFAAVCTKRGLTLRAVAKELGMSHTYVSDLQNGRRAPSADVAKRVREWAVKETG